MLLTPLTTGYPASCEWETLQGPPDVVSCPSVDMEDISYSMWGRIWIFNTEFLLHCWLSKNYEV